MLEPPEKDGRKEIHQESPIQISSDSEEDVSESLEIVGEEEEIYQEPTAAGSSDYNKDTKVQNSPDFEKDINKAFEDSLKEDSILPILKHELRLKIQTRRLSEGKKELKPEKQKPKVYELTEEEKEKYQRRLNQNRQSLQKARQKALEHEDKLKMTFNAETSRKEVLKRERDKLLLEKDNLLKELHNAGMELDNKTSTISCTKCKMTLLYLVPR